MTSPTPITPAQYRITLGFAGFMAVGGAALLIFGVSFLKDARASRAWPTTTGEVQAVNVVRDRSTTNSSSRSYHYAVTYGYEVEERTYSSDRYSLGNGSTASKQYDTRTEAQSAGQESYPAGSEVMVYYDPTNPASTVLKPGANFGTYVPLVMGLVFLPFGLVLLITMVRTGQPQG